MKSTTITLVFYLMFVSGAIAQDVFNPPDYAAVEKITSDKSSDFYYPGLYKRFIGNDTSLDIQHYRLLYYGYFYHKHTVGEGEVDYSLQDSLSAYRRKDTLTAQESQKVLNWTKQLLKSDPFNPDTHYRLFRMYDNSGDEISAQIHLHKVRMLARTIVSTGNGASCKTAYHVTAIPHEYFMLRSWSLVSTGQTLTEDQCDYHKLAENDKNLSGMYFDVKQIFMGYNEMFKDVKLTVPGTQNEKKKNKRTRQ